MRVSTIIPVYNRADLIGETLRSILSQSRPPHEVIVVDDGSTDGTPDAVAAFGKEVTLLRQSNAGAGPARNAGFARSTGEIVNFMDSDDLATLNFYEVAASAIERGADMTYGPLFKARIDGCLLEPEEYLLQQGPVTGTIPMSTLVLLLRWVTVLQPCLFRRELIERAGPYRSDLAPSEDREMLYRILLHAKAPAHTPEILVLYRVHPENQISAQDTARRFVDMARLATVFQQHVDDRRDLDPAVRRKFMRSKALLASEVRRYHPAKAEELAADLGALDRSLRPLYGFLTGSFARRVASKLQRIKTDSPFPSVYAAGRLRPEQRDEIARLGYVLPA